MPALTNQQKIDAMLSSLALQPGVEKTYNDAHQASYALVAIKNRLVTIGYVLDSENIQGDTLVCSFVGPIGTITTVQDINEFGLTITIEPTP